MRSTRAMGVAVFVYVALGAGCSLLTTTEAVFRQASDGGVDGGMDAGTLADSGADADAETDAGIDAGPPPPAPELVFPWLGFHADQSLELRWGEVADADAYEAQVTFGCSPGEACPFDAARTVTQRTPTTDWTPDAGLALRSDPPRERVYSWRVRACSGSLCSEWSPVRYFVFGPRSDVNGDGVPDVAVGAPDGGDGSLHVYIGAAATPRWTLAFGASGARFGSAVALLGDVDGDGYGDVAVGAPGEDLDGQIDSGRAYVVLGGGAEPASEWQAVAPPMPLNFISFGNGVDAIGDVNGDGYADVAVRAPNLPTTTISTAGGVFVYYGNPDGLTGPTTLRGGEPSVGAHFGAAAAGGADLDADGFPDFIVGEPDSMEPGGRIGRVWIFDGSATGMTETARELARPAALEAGASFGSAVTLVPSAEPLIVVGAPGAPARGLDAVGRVFIYRAADPSAPAWILEAESPASGERFGAAVAYAGDVDDDGDGDLLVGVPGRRFEVVLMEPSGPGARWPASGTGQHGARVAGVGDVNGDRLADVAVTDWSGGSARVWLSASTALADPPRLSVSDTGRFGWAVSGEVP